MFCKISKVILHYCEMRELMKKVQRKFIYSEVEGNVLAIHEKAIRSAILVTNTRHGVFLVIIQLLDFDFRWIRMEMEWLLWIVVILILY